ncbi:MAG: hypothetical protein WC764_01275 [Candidatus Paceibacterota bacterium]|jgi:hypothetical protein
MVKPRIPRKSVSQGQTEFLQIRFSYLYGRLDGELAQRLLDNEEALEYLLLSKINLCSFLAETGLPIEVGSATPHTQKLLAACRLNYIEDGFSERFNWEMPCVSEGVNAGNRIVFEPIELGDEGYHAETPRDLVNQMYKKDRERTGRGDSDLSPISLREAYLFVASFPWFCEKRYLFIPWVNDRGMNDTVSRFPMFANRAGRSLESVSIHDFIEQRYFDNAYVLAKREKRS